MAWLVIPCDERKVGSSQRMDVLHHPPGGIVGASRRSAAVASGTDGAFCG